MMRQHALREFEIELFWKRALFFWGFQAAAFVAIATAHGKSPRLAVGIASFGVVCAWAWTLASRGSKYWYENWERKLQSAENMVTGPLFSEIAEPKNPRKWLSGNRYSVSRLTIGLSDYAVGFWFVILAYEIASLWLYSLPRVIGDLMATLFAATSITYAWVLKVNCLKHDDP